MKIKKILVIILLLLLFVSMVACDNTPKTSSTPTPTPKPTPYISATPSAIPYENDEELIEGLKKMGKERNQILCDELFKIDYTLPKVKRYGISTGQSTYSYSYTVGDFEENHLNHVTLTVCFYDYDKDGNRVPFDRDGLTGYGENLGVLKNYNDNTL